MMMCTKSNGI